MTWKRGEMCGSCAGRKDTEANQSAETMKTLAECIETGEPFYCHESTAVPDPNGTAVDRRGNRYRHLPEHRWRLCRAWTSACPEGGRVTYASKEEARADWHTIAPRHRTKERLAEMLRNVRKPRDRR